MLSNCHAINTESLFHLIQDEAYGSFSIAPSLVVARSSSDISMGQDDITDTETSQEPIDIRESSVVTSKRKRVNTSWVYENDWAIVKADEKTGTEYIHCQYPFAPNRNCNKRYKKIGATTSNILHHLTAAHKVNSSTRKADILSGSARTLDNMFARTTSCGVAFSEDAFRRALINFVISSALPFNIVESQEFQELLSLAQTAASTNQVLLPSAMTVSRDLSNTSCSSMQSLMFSRSNRSYPIRWMDGPVNGEMRFWV